MKITVFTSLDNGGILQLANQITESLKCLGHSCKLYVPKGAEQRCNQELLPLIAEYDLPKTTDRHNQKVKQLADCILEGTPDLVMAVDDAIRACILLQNMDKRTKKVIFVHDVTPHIQKFSLRIAAVECVRSLHRLGAFAAAGKVVLLSRNSEEKFAKRYKRFRAKSTVLPLGAHIVPAEPQMPPELSDMAEKEFALFFGRIDKYKGVDRLLLAHDAACENSQYGLQLVVAGRPVSAGLIPENNNPGTTLINRYISDGEMLWLFDHCKVVVLPYYEASQSGVLPIAYKYGKPVIVSDIPGLRELVEKGKTGTIFTTTEDLKNALLRFAGPIPQQMSPAVITEYYNAHYDWCGNLNRLMESISKDITTKTQ